MLNQFTDPAVATEDGVFISDKWLRLSEILQDMDPTIELRWIPPRNRTDMDKSKPYAIVHSPPDKKSYIIMFAGDTDDPQDILARLWSGNTRKGNVLTRLDAIEAAKKAFEQRAALDSFEEAADEMHFMATSRSNWFIKRKRPDGTLVTIDTQTGAVVK